MNWQLYKAVRAAGSVIKLANALNISRQTIYKWGDKIPADYIVAIERETGVPREELRPDLYR